MVGFVIRCKVSCSFNLGVKAMIYLGKNFLVYGFAYPKSDEMTEPDENTHQTHNTVCDAGRKAPPPFEIPCL